MFRALVYDCLHEFFPVEGKSYYMASKSSRFKEVDPYILYFRCSVFCVVAVGAFAGYFTGEEGQEYGDNVKRTSGVSINSSEFFGH